MIESRACPIPTRPCGATQIRWPSGPRWCSSWVARQSASSFTVRPLRENCVTMPHIAGLLWRSMWPGSHPARCEVLHTLPAPLGRAPAICRSSYKGLLIPTMRSVGIKVLKNRLSEYIRLASTGETILITDRDRVVAELIPPNGTRADRLPDALLAEAVRSGLVTPALLPPGPPPE